MSNDIKQGGFMQTVLSAVMGAMSPSRGTGTDLAVHQRPGAPTVQQQRRTMEILSPDGRTQMVEEDMVVIATRRRFPLLPMGEPERAHVSADLQRQFEQFSDRVYVGDQWCWTIFKRTDISRKTGELIGFYEVPITLWDHRVTVYRFMYAMRFGQITQVRAFPPQTYDLETYRG